MNNNYFCISTRNESDFSEALIALMSEMPFDTFEESEIGVKAYIKKSDFNQDIENQLVELSNTFNFDFSIEEIEAQNWNEVWESNFNPIVIGDFCGIRADFHAPIPKVEYEIVINPKMAFGTGHHETTHMMIEAMKNIDFHSKRVFDYGCGTGILAIMAGKLGATDIVGVDNEYPAYESTIENAEINGVPFIKSIFGTLKDVNEGNFDIILANINRNIIINSLDVLFDKLNPEGIMMMSGFLKEDESFMRNAIEMKGLTFIETKQKGNWICMKVGKKMN